MSKLFEKARRALAIVALNIALLALVLPVAAVALVAVPLLAVAIAVAYLAVGALVPSAALVDVLEWVRDGRAERLTFPTVRRAGRLLPGAAVSREVAGALRDVLRLYAERMEVDIRVDVVTSVLRAMRGVDLDTIEVALHGVTVRRSGDDVHVEAAGRAWPGSRESGASPTRRGRVLSWLLTAAFAVLVVLDNPGWLTVCVALVVVAQEALLHGWMGLAATWEASAGTWKGNAKIWEDNATTWENNARAWRAYADRLAEAADTAGRS